MTDFELCLPCARLRGQTRRGWQGCGHLPGTGFAGCDVAEEADLCVLCARGLAGGSSRWSWLACGSCRSWEQAARDRLGRMLLPLGRHSIMNGVGVPVRRLPEDDGPQVRALLDQFVGWDRLHDWRKEEVARLAAAASIAGDAVPYEQWAKWHPASCEASRDAYLRLRGVDPAWVVDTFPVIPRHAGRDPEEGEWKPAEVGQPRPGETVGISPGPDGHDVAITTNRLRLWFTARCAECDWSRSGVAFPVVRRQATQHASDGGAR